MRSVCHLSVTSDPEAEEVSQGQPQGGHTQRPKERWPQGNSVRSRGCDEVKRAKQPALVGDYH